MITIKKESYKTQDQQSSQQMFIVKNYVDYSQTEQVKCKQKTDAKHIQKKLRQSIINVKKDKISKVFAEKLMRRLDSDDFIMQKIWKQQQSLSETSIEGFTYPQAFEHVLEIFNIIIIPLLIVISSLEGFLDQFSKQYSGKPQILILKILCLIVTALRFFIKCTSPTFSEGQFKKYIKQIIGAYWKTNKFMFDFTFIILQIISVIWFTNMVIQQIMFFYLNFWIVYFGNDTVRIQAAYIQSKKTSLILSLFKIIIFNVLFAHFMATIILGMSKLQPEKSWIIRAQIQQQPWFVKYIYAYYWATTIMMTVGFGDILPGSNNYKQMMITSFLEMFSCIVLGYNISSIGNIVATIRSANQNINRKIVVFQRMIKKNRRKNNVKIDPLLQKRITNYLQELRIDKDNLQYEERNQLLSQLPQNLRRAYYKEANKRIFPNVQFFKELRQETLGKMAQTFKNVFYNHGDLLSTKKKSVLILQKGKIGLAFRKRGSTQNGKIMQTIKVQQGKQDKETILLNPISFLTFMQQQKYDLVSTSYSIVWEIEYRQFLKILKQSKIDSQYYFNIIHKHSIDENQWEFIQCNRCSNNSFKRTHSAFNCPKLSYLPLRSVISQFYCLSNLDTLQERQSNFKRKRPNLTLNQALCVKTQFSAYYEKVQKSQSYKIKSTRKIPVVEINSSSFHRKSHKRLSVTISQQQSPQPILTQLKLKDIIKQVLYEHETGYQQQQFWTLQCDKAYNYNFYFNLDNSNRYFLTPMTIHPRKCFYSEYKELSGDNKIRAIGYLYKSPKNAN